MKSILTPTVLSLLLFISCSPSDQQTDLYDGFKNPPADARPFVRWWWNGNKITKEELIREVDVMREAGIGGVEINPIAFPQEAMPTDVKSLIWLSEEWNQLLVETTKYIKSQGMIADMIVGSGWPFGEEFLTEDQVLQRIVTYQQQVKGPTSYRDPDALIQSASSEDNQGQRHEAEVLNSKLLFMRLIPEGVNSVDKIIDLKGQNEIVIPAGNYTLTYGYQETGHRNVMFGAPGAKGPVMDHYDKKVLFEYLERLKKIEKDTGVSLSEILRALFCDSIELAGSNWTDGFDSLFQEKYGYDLAPYYPFVFYGSYQGYEENEYDSPLKEEIRRARYDYNSLLVDTFIENFVVGFDTFCNDNGLLSRYQAYGTPYLMGMIDGNMVADIPESNNWIFSAPLDTPKWLWNQGHGYMIWNMYAAAGGHLTGKKIISSEAMTNTRGVFQLTLEDIKQADDMNFITGINHSVLHGYNYSPPEAGFPGWIRFGAYFSDQNTWWPYFRHWADYNARLSYVFQHSQTIKKVAILGPETDLWSDVGLSRGPFHMTPQYLYKLWEPISQIGSSCEYINERIIRESDKSGGTLKFGPMEYEALIIVGVSTMHAETANALVQYVEKGGKLVFVETLPSKSASMTDANGGDQVVDDMVKRMLKQFPDQVSFQDPPGNTAELMSWTNNLWRNEQLPYDVIIDNPDDDVYQLHQTTDHQEIFFFTNTHRKWSSSFTATFQSEGKTAWIWEPETGEKIPFPTKNQDRLIISLNPMESILLVFSEEKGSPQVEEGSKEPISTPLTLTGDWDVTFEPAFGEPFNYEMPLADLSKSNRKNLRSFAGQAVYSKTFIPDQDYNFITLGNVNRGVTEVTINGEPLGVRWYGKHRYDVTDKLKLGEPNKIEIRLTTTLANYAKSLRDNEVAQRWLRGFVSKSEGLEGPVVFR